MPTKKTDFIQWLRENRACSDGLQWAIDNKITSADQAWSKLPRTDWMFWLANARKSEIVKDKKGLRLFAADCAESVLHIFESRRPGDDRPRKAIQAARDFAEGKISQLDLSKARYAAAYAADAAYAARAAYAADAARAAAYDAYDAAAYAVYAAAAYAVYAAAARVKSRADQRLANSNFLRKYFKKL